MKALLLILVILSSALASCNTGTSGKQGNQTPLKVEAAEPDEYALPERQYITDPAEKKILSICDTLYIGDTLKIKFKAPHASDFGIVTPNGRFFFVVYGGNDTTKPSLVDYLEFANLEYLEMVTDRIKANPWDVRINENQLVFTVSGKYLIQLSETLDTDDGTPVEEEEVYYFDKPRERLY